MPPGRFLTGWLAPALLMCQQPEGKFTIAGIVRNQLTGAPIGQAKVTIEVSPVLFRETLTDPAGSFRFYGLPAGRHKLSVYKPGFATKEKEGREVTLGPSQENVVLAIVPLGTISGRVSDQHGEPVSHVRIEAFSSVVQAGRRQLRFLRWVGTDDRGEYRFYDLDPGRYFLRAAGRSGGTMLGVGEPPAMPDSYESFVPVYYGGAQDVSTALPILIGEGEDSRADFTLTMTTARKIEGKVVGLASYRPAEIQLFSGAGELFGQRALLHADSGRFQIHDVVDGAYKIRVRQGSGVERVEGETVVQVAGRDVSGVEIRVTPGVLVTGLIRLQQPQSQKVHSSLTLCSATLTPATPSYDRLPRDSEFRAKIDRDGSFQFENVTAGRYRFEVRCPSLFYLASATCGDKDLLEDPEISVRAASPPDPIEVVFIWGAATIQGMVVAASGPLEDARVILAAEGPPKAPPRQVVTEDVGYFYLHGVRPGNYRLIALPPGVEVEYAEPRILQQLLAAGEKLQVTAEGRHRVVLKPLRDWPR